MKINWETVVSVAVALLLIGALYSYFTKKTVNPDGTITTSFSGFGGN